MAHRNLRISSEPEEKHIHYHYHYHYPTTEQSESSVKARISDSAIYQGQHQKFSAELTPKTKQTETQHSEVGEVSPLNSKRMRMSEVWKGGNYGIQTPVHEHDFSNIKARSVVE